MKSLSSEKIACNISFGLFKIEMIMYNIFNIIKNKIFDRLMISLEKYCYRGLKLIIILPSN